VCAGVERSFSAMNRICNRLRQRLTDSHLSQLMLISHEGPELLSRQDLQEIAYYWYRQSPRRIQLPSLPVKAVTNSEGNENVCE